MDLLGINPLYSLAGLLVGFLVGVTGVGGGSLMTPILVLVFGFHPATAVGTDLLYAATTKSVGTAMHSRGGTVDWTVVRRLATGSVPATAVTLLLLARISIGDDHSQHVLSTVLGVALMATAVAILFRGWIVARSAHLFDRLTKQQIGGLTMLLGAILGVLVSLTSVGAGALG